MNFNFLTIFISLFLVKFVISKSFTVVLDTTASMQDEIDTIKMNIASLTDIMRNLPEFEDFIVVPFNDPDVGPPIISQNHHSLISFFNSISANGGNECPEDSLTGIQKALEYSKPNSFVYVFTDAYAKDITKFTEIERLCKSSQSQVVIFLSGSCSGSDMTQGNVDIYYDIAKACSGAVFKFDSVNLRKAFHYMKEMVKTDWNEIINYEPFTGYKDFHINVDSFTSDLLIAISGNYPILQTVDSDQIQKIVDTRQTLIVRVVNVRSGQYKVGIRCQGLTSLTLYKKSQVPYEYGFSTRLPKSLEETSRRPMPGHLNYMLIVIPHNNNFKITSMELQMTDGSEKKLLSIEESQVHQGYYTTSVFVEPSTSFTVLIHGRDSSYQETTTTTKIIEAQAQAENGIWSKPVVEILEMDNNLIDYATNVTVVCKVKGYPEPEIVWEDDEGTTLTSENVLLEIPSIYISYVTLNATSNHTIHCKATNDNGTDEKSLDLFVNRTFIFEVVQVPQNETFEYGSEGKLYCEVNAYPEAEIKWTHNSSSIDYSENIEFIDEENALVIKNMTVDDVGVYECKVTNEVQTRTFAADVSISGLEAPQLEVENTVVDLKPGDFYNIECRVIRGNPVPEITWKYQIPNGNYFDSAPSDVYADGSNLKISVVKKEHKGVYKCTAHNMMGEDSKEISVNIKYAPIISSGEEGMEEGILNVREGSKVTLPCEVDATPEATVRWEASQGDTLLNLDSRHAIDDRYTLRFTALWKDSGVSYRCTAENEVGRSEKIVTLNVLVAPYIQATESRTVTVDSGSDVTLPCIILYGNPVPSTKWEFIATDSTTSVLSRSHSTTANLHLKNVSKANEGMYLCIADNDVGNDRIKMYLKVN